MAASGVELIRRSVTIDRVEREYHVTGTNDESDVSDFIATLPTTIGDFAFSTYIAEEHPDIPNDYLLRVTWGTPQYTSSGQDENTTEYRFNFQAPGGHIYQSLATILLYGPGGSPDVPYFDGAINVVDDEGKQRVEGVNLSPPAEVFTLSYVANDSIITGSYQLIVEGLCGCVNSTSFRGRAAGSVMLVRASGGRDRSGKWSIEFGFGYIANSTSIPVGDEMTIPSKDGFDYLWAYYGSTKDDDAKSVVKRPAAAYVERIYPRADLNELNLPT